MLFKQQVHTKPVGICIWKWILEKSQHDFNTIFRKFEVFIDLVSSICAVCDFYACRIIIRFDTSSSSLIFSDQFLQLTTTLASPYVFGIGESSKENFMHDMNFKSWPLLASNNHPNNARVRTNSIKLKRHQSKLKIRRKTHNKNIKYRKDPTFTVNFLCILTSSPMATAVLSFSTIQIHRVNIKAIRATWFHNCIQCYFYLWMRFVKRSMFNNYFALFKSFIWHRFPRLPTDPSAVFSTSTFSLDHRLFKPLSNFSKLLPARVTIIQIVFCFVFFFKTII